MKSYELCVLFSGNNTSEEINELAKQAEEFLKTVKAEIKLTHNLARKKLAYNIKGNNHGEYRCWYFCVEPNVISALNKKLRLSNFVIRHLLLSMTDSEFETRLKKIKDIESGKYKKPQITEESSRGTNLTARRMPATPAEFAAPEPKSEEIKPAKKKLSIEELDEKLDQILENDKI